MSDNMRYVRDTITTTADSGSETIWELMNDNRLYAVSHGRRRVMALHVFDLDSVREFITEYNGQTIVEGK